MQIVYNMETCQARDGMSMNTLEKMNKPVKTRFDFRDLKKITYLHSFLDTVGLYDYGYMESILGGDGRQVEGLSITYY